jgi:hypothetical protein
MELRELEWGDVYLTDLARDRDEWRALVDKVVDLRVS